MPQHSEAYRRAREAQKPEPAGKPIVLPATLQGPTREKKSIPPTELGVGQQASPPKSAKLTE